MTIPAHAEGFGGRLPSAGEKAAANQLRKILAAHTNGETKISVLDDDRKPSEVVLSPTLSHLLMELLRYVSSGDAVTIVPFGQMLTTQQAADILNVSRLYLISLLNQGAIDFEHVGRHRRIKAQNLFAYKKARDIRRSDALSELASMDAEYI